MGQRDRRLGGSREGSDTAELLRKRRTAQIARSAAARVQFVRGGERGPQTLRADSPAERVAARAADRGGLVALAVAVTGQAGRAIAARCGFVRRVAGRAGRMV